MNFGDIWLRTENGEVVNLRDFKELKISDFGNNQAFINIFNNFDIQKADKSKGADGILNKEELVSLFTEISKTAKTQDNPSVLDIREAETFLENAKNPNGKTLKELGVTSSDIFDFLLKLTQRYEPLEGENELSRKQKIRMNEIKKAQNYARLSENKKKFILEAVKHDIQVYETLISTMLQNPDEEYSEEILSRFKKVVSDRDFDIDSYINIYALSKLDDRQYNLAKEIYKTQNQHSPLEIYEIASLVSKTQPEDIEDLKSLLIELKENSEEYDSLYSSHIERIMSLDKPLREKCIDIIKNENVEQYQYSMIAILMPVWEHLPENFLEKYPNFVISRAPGGGIGFSTDISRNDSYLYDQTGLYEIRQYDKDTNTELVINKKTNTIDEIKYKDIPGFEKIVVSEIITQYDSITIDDTKNWLPGNIVKTTTRNMGKVEGVYIITETDANGNINPNQLQYETIDENGNTYVQKDFVSPAGIQTHFTYEETADNMVILDYVIIGKDEKTGKPKTLLDKHQTIQQMKDGRIITTVNSRVYEAKFEDNKLIVTDKTKNITKTFKLDEDFITKGKDVILNILKNVPANQLMALDKIPINAIFYNEDNSHYLNNACWSPEKRHLEIGQHQLLEEAFLHNDYKAILNNLFPVFLHEYGHYIDSDIISGMSSAISKDKHLNEVFIKEFKNFVEVTNSTQQKYIDYFTDITQEHISIRSSQERVAESNMLLNTLPPVQYANRATYLQQYFPETIAMIAKMIDERIES